MSLIFHSDQIGIYLLMCEFAGQIGIDLFVLGVRTWALRSGRRAACCAVARS